ncbi:RNA polymerase sigma factor [Halalkalibaculum sp. DA3122]
MSDSELVKKIRKGKKHALREIYERYHEQLYYVAKRYLKDEAFAEDAIQDIFLKLWKKRKELDPARSIKGLLFSMLKNHVIDMIRKRKTRNKVKDGYKKLSEDNRLRNSTIEELILAEYKDLVIQALKKLTPAQRKVFKMRSFEGLTNAEIAEKNNVSIHTVKTQYYRSSKFIREYLGKRDII